MRKQVTNNGLPKIKNLQMVIDFNDRKSNNGNDSLVSYFLPSRRHYIPAGVTDLRVIYNTIRNERFAYPTKQSRSIFNPKDANTFKEKFTTCFFCRSSYS